MTSNAAVAYNSKADEWATRLRSGKNDAHRFLEKPAMFAKLPNLAGKRILCMGCGSGEEVEMLFAAGAEAAHIIGIDVAENQIESARAAFPAVTFEVRSIEDLGGFADASFDYVYSSLTLHYLPDWLPLLCEVRRILVKNGRMLFSTHHPVKWGSLVQRAEEGDRFEMSYYRPAGGLPPVVKGDYLGMRKINDTWFGNMDVSYYHRSLEAIMRDVLDSGLRLVDFLEPMPTEEARAEKPAFWEIHSRIPLFMIFELEAV